MYLNSNNPTINKIYQTLQSTKDLLVSSLIFGEKYIGKKSLVKQIFNNSYWVDGSNIDDVKKALKQYSHIVITNFEKINNYDILDFENINVVAIYNGRDYDKRLENKFAFIYHIPPLNQRKEDIELFSRHFLQEAKEIFDIDEDIKIDTKDLDLSKNLKSLKSSIYKALIFKSAKKDDLIEIMHNYFLKNYKGINVYKEQLEIFEKTLIITGLEIYGSQLKLSEVLGINRNTLRKKINEYF